jgi:hypothetical protein
LSPTLAVPSPRFTIRAADDGLPAYADDVQ